MPYGGCRHHNFSLKIENYKLKINEPVYQETFEGIGLSPNEAKIYETLVEHGELGVSEIATRSQIHRRNAYDAIRRLIDRKSVV